MMKKISIAIDGPAAAGKSTVAKIVAEKLSYVYIDTGAMYRSITYQALQKNIDVTNEEALLDLLSHTHLELVYTEEGQRVIVDGQDVSEAIRTPEVTSHVSQVAQHKGIREDMVRRQRELASRGGVVMDGRDIGTHVLPNAEVKIFMLASVEERAIRRHKENLEKGFSSDLEKLKEEIALRDKMDSEREIAPLVKAGDAIELDTTSLTKDEVVEKMLEIVQTHL